MISKELFESIYDMKINRLEVDEYSNIWIDIDSKHLSRFDSLNNFFFKCKQWAYERGFIIESGFHKNAINASHTRCFGWVSETIDIENTFNGTTEFDVVVKSCEWIKQEVLNDK